MRQVTGLLITAVLIAACGSSDEVASQQQADAPTESAGSVTTGQMNSLSDWIAETIASRPDSHPVLYLEAGFGWERVDFNSFGFESLRDGFNPDVYDDLGALAEFTWEGMGTHLDEVDGVDYGQLMIEAGASERVQNALRDRPTVLLVGEHDQTPVFVSKQT